MTAYDDLFETDQSRVEKNGEKVVSLPLSEIDDFKNHPFKVRMDDSMAETVDSIRSYGVLVPALVRPKENGRYEMVAGHRRKKGCELAELSNIPCIIRNLSDDEATIIMVDTNLQREQVLPSEKAFAYKMKLGAVKRQQGERTDLTSATVLQKLDGKTSRELLAEKSPDSHEQIRKYIRLTELIPELLQFRDNEALGIKPQISMRPAVELSYLPKEQQQFVLTAIESECCTPSHDQTLRMREKSREGLLDEDEVLSIMSEEKPNQKEQIKIPKDRINKYFPTGTPAQKMEDDIIKGLELLHRQRERNRDAR